MYNIARHILDVMQKYDSSPLSINIISPITIVYTKVWT